MKIYIFIKFATMNPISSEKKRRNSFVTTPEQAITQFTTSSSNSTDSLSSSSSKYDASIAISSAKKQKTTVGVFSVAFGDHQLDYHATHSAASNPGIVRLGEEGKAPNMYWNVFTGSANRPATVFSGAAQGVMEENIHANDSAQGPKFKSVKKHDDYVADQLCTHIAHGLLGHMIQYNYQNKNFSFDAVDPQYLDLDGYQPPQILQLSNYMTDLRLSIGDAKQVAPRKKEIENLIVKINQASGKHNKTFAEFIGLQQYDSNRMQQEAQDFLNNFNKKVAKRVLEAAIEKGLLPEEAQEYAPQIEAHVAEIMQPDKFVFNRQGLNAFRVVASWSDSSQLRQKAQQVIKELSKKLEQEENPARQAQIQKQIDKITSVSRTLYTTELRYRISQLLYMITLGIPALLSVAVNRTGFLERLPFSLSTNFPLHKEALKLNLITLIDGASVGGCQSAKDRFGSLVCFARAQEDYIATYGVAPPAYGLLGFVPGFMSIIGKGLSLLLSPLARISPDITPISNFFRPLAQLIENYSADRQIFFKDRFAEHWISGAIQYIADANAAGALGIKNNSQIIPAAYRNVIEQKIEEKIKSCYDKLCEGVALLNTPEEITEYLESNQHVKELQLLTLLLPNVSEQLAKINEAVKKTPEEAQKLHEKIVKKSEKYIMPVLENIFSMTTYGNRISAEHKKLLQNFIKNSIKQANEASDFSMSVVYDDSSDKSFTGSNPSLKNLNDDSKERKDAKLSSKEYISNPPPGVFTNTKSAKIAPKKPAEKK